MLIPQSLVKNKFLRAIVIPTLKFFDRDIQIRHPWTNEKITLSLFLHRGFWFNSKKREFEEIEFCRELITNGNIIIEVGGHIGFLSLLFRKLATSSGQVYVFEPGKNNLPYLYKNVFKKENIKIIDKACSQKNGYANLYIENLTGQNNSLNKNFEIFNENSQNAPNIKITKEAIKVETISLDSFCKSNKINPDFIKVDVEGHELSVLKGAKKTLLNEKKPIIMIEIQSNYSSIITMLKELDYVLFNKKRKIIKSLPKHGNIFALNKIYHKDLIEKILKSSD